MTSLVIVLHGSSTILWFAAHLATLVQEEGKIIVQTTTPQVLYKPRCIMVYSGTL